MGVPLDVAGAYSRDLKAVEIARLYQVGVMPDNTPPQFQKDISRFLKKMYRREELKNKLSQLSFIDTGSTSLIMRGEGYAWKFSRDLAREAKMLTKVMNCEEASLDNIMLFAGDIYEGVALQLEYIEGRTLERFLADKGALPAQQTIRYSTGTLNGIVDTRLAGLYHRDLHDRNVMIDEVKDRPVIIDFGVATDNPAEVHSHFPRGWRTVGGGALSCLLPSAQSRPL